MSTGLPTVTFADLIFHHALTRPEKPAVIVADRAVTYAMVAQAILRVEKRVLALTLPQHSLVCVTLTNPIRHMVVAAALFRCGHQVMSATQATDVARLQLPVAAFLEAPGLTMIAGLRQVVVSDDWFEGDVQSLSPRPASAYPDEQTICRVELSSGTTGRPKAVSLTLSAFNQWLANYGQSLGQAHWDRLLCLPGLTNSWGFTLAAHALFRGKTILFADAARTSLQLIAMYGVDCLVASSQQLRELCREQTAAPVPCQSLRVVMTGGSLVSQGLIAEARAKLCSALICQYGSTEAGAT